MLSLVCFDNVSVSFADLGRPLSCHVVHMHCVSLHDMAAFGLCLCRDQSSTLAAHAVTVDINTIKGECSGKK